MTSPTSLFNTTESQFELPAAWVDRSISVFQPQSAEGDGGPSIVISRERLDGDLATHADKVFQGLRRALPRFELVWNRPRTVGPMDAVDVRFRWSKDGSRVDQRLVMMAYYDELLVHTASAALDRAEALQPVFEHFLVSMRLRRRGGAP